MFSPAHSSPRSSIATTRCTLLSIAARESRTMKSLALLRWGCVSERACLSSNQLVPSRTIVALGINGSARQCCHHIPSRISVKRWQRVLELVSAAKSRRWIRDYAAATVAVLVVQAVIAQDISLALSSTSHAVFSESRVPLVDFTVSQCSKSGSISCCGMRLGSVRCGAKKLTAGKSSQLLRVRTYATPNMNGASITRQGRGKPGFAGVVGGQLKASSTALNASSLSLALITSSLASPLAAIANAGSHMDLNVLRASFASSLNLISLC